MTAEPRPDALESPGPRFRIDVADVWLLAGLLAIGVLLPTVVGAVAGTLEIPRNDDWSYRTLALDVARTGQLRLDGAASTMLIGELLIVQPFLWLTGLQPWAFTVAGIVFAGAAVIATFLMARQILPPWRAAIVGLLVAVFPGYLAYATSFMTDVPTLACQFACLALGARAVRDRPVSLRWLVAALVLGFIGFSIRDFALAAPASVALVAICAEPRRARHWIIAIVVIASFVALHAWRSTLSGVIDDPPFQPGSGERLVPALTTIAFAVSPAAILSWSHWRGIWRRSDLTVGAVLGLALIAAPLVVLLYDRHAPTALLPNLTTQWGSPGPEFLLGGRPLLFSDRVWTVINVVAMIAVVIVSAACAGIVGAVLRRWGRSPVALVRRLGSPPGVLLVFALSAGGGLFLYGLIFHLFDRYLWAIAAPLAALLLYVPRDLGPDRPPAARRDRSRARWAGATLLGATLGFVSVVLLFNAHAFDAARWQAGERLVELGVPAGEVDAGYEWVGFHADSVANAARPVPARTWYEGWWKSFRPCGIVSSEPLTDPEARPLETMAYRLNLVAGPDATLYLYRLAEAGCPRS
jgi:Dolichyl-phosphate-mannose-protein mannosyltransferase